MPGPPAMQSSSPDPFLITTNEPLHSITADPAGPFAPSCYINLQGPAGLELAFENPSEQFGPQTFSVPIRLAVLDDAMARFKLVRREAGSAKTIYARLDSGHLSKDDAELVMKAALSLPLTTDDLDRASSGTDVVKVLVLVRDKKEQAGKPEFEVLTSTSTQSGSELIADAASRGAVVASLLLSQRVPEMRPLLQPSMETRFGRFSLRGPQGLMVDYESDVPGKFNHRPQPVPAEFAILPGSEMRLQLTGAAASVAAPLYSVIWVSRAWPAELGPPGQTELLINISVADLDAAAAGEPLTQVIYFSKQSNKEEPSLETLSSRSVPRDSDPIVEASRRGHVLATVRLTKELPAVRSVSLRAPPDADAALPGTIDRAAVQPAAVEREMTQMLFLGPKGMNIQWDVTAPGKFDSEPLAAPGRYNFPRGAVYRLKISQIPGHEGTEIFPTLEVAPTTPNTAEYLSANGVPVELSAEDIDHVLSGKSITKVVFVPDTTDPDAPRGVGTLVSSRLQAGLDPIREADRLGAILAILRAGEDAADKVNGTSDDTQ